MPEPTPAHFKTAAAFRAWLRKHHRAGLAVFEAREEARTGVYSFEQRSTELTPAYRRRFKAAGAAWAWFQHEAPWYRRTSSHWVMSAKREATRIKRLETLIADSAAGSLLRPSGRATGRRPRG